MSESPVRPYRSRFLDSGVDSYTNRILIGTATTGLIRIEWSMARYGQIIPVNWSAGTHNQVVDAFVPMRFQVADAQNLIVRAAIEKDYEWLIFVEHDVILPPLALATFNQYILEEEYPVVSGLYYSRGNPCDPLLFRGRGTSVYTDWKIGDKVMVDGVPTGCLMIHMGILREMWKDSEEYMIVGQKTRRVFNTPRASWLDPESKEFVIASGTSDLEWCSRVITQGYLDKAGWTEIAKLEYPFVVDTNIFCRHIDTDGTMYPPEKK